MSGINISLKVEDGGTIEAFRAARREMRKVVKTSVAQAAQRIVLPSVKRRAQPHLGPFTTSLRAKAQGSGAAYITATNSKKGSVIALHNWGGMVRTQIRPKNKRALTVGDGVIAHVKTPRHYTGKKFIEAGIKEKLQEFNEHVGEDVFAALEQRIG